MSLSPSLFFSLQCQELDQDSMNRSNPSTNLGISELSDGWLLPLSGQFGEQNCNREGPTLRDFFVKHTSCDHRARLSVAPLGPFTGYSAILKSSKFLRPAQEVLEYMCRGCGGGLDYLPFELSVENDIAMVGTVRTLPDKMGCGGMRSKLILMLNEVYRRYSIYCQQMQSVLSSFGAVDGMGNAAPYLCCAIKVVRKYFTCLKNALLDQINFAGRASEDENSSRENTGRACGVPGSRSLRNPDSALAMKLFQNPVWRSQRGLPDQAVAVLKAWLFEHFLHPYPTDLEKQSLAKQTGLSRTQVSNWFINARVRLWKPMVEEVHMLETQQAQSRLQSATRHSISSLPEAGRRQAICKQGKRYRLEVSRSNLHDRSACDGSPRDHLLDSSVRHNFSLALGLPENNSSDISHHAPMTTASHPGAATRCMASSGPSVTTTMWPCSKLPGKNLEATTLCDVTETRHP